MNDKPTTTLVTFLLDRSGSMETIKPATISGFNTYLDTLKKEGTGIEFSLVQFDTVSVDKVHVNKPIASVPALTDMDFQPRGGTPLIDAAYEIIKAVEASVATRAQAPQVVVTIMTDGEENSSTQHGWDDLQALIKEKTLLGWQFVFLGCSIDAYAQGVRMGIAAESIVSMDSADPVTMTAGLAASASNSALYSSGARKDLSYDMGQRRAAGEHRVKHSNPVGAKPTSPTPSPTPPPRQRSKPIVDKIEL